MKFENSWQTLPSFFYETVTPTPLKEAQLVHATSLQQDLSLEGVDLKAWLNGEMRLPGDQTIATRYAGHQFGVWAGQLGDGRAISLGEILTASLGRQEVQTKGSGLTPFSRRGDGKAVIRSSVREYLCSEAMEGLGIPTTRVLALLTGRDDVYREQVERSAIVARVFPSNLRFGHFEMGYHFGKQAELKSLIEYTRVTFYNSISVEEMLQTIVERTAKLIAQWQGVGFCHGVMNTDNMSFLGLTLDYGPFGFLEDTVLNYICNHSDHQGRYAYNQQPSVGMWNLERLLVCFIDVVPKEKLQQILSSYPEHFDRAYLSIAREKLGLKNPKENDYDLFIKLLQTLNQLSIDYTFFFRELCSYKRLGLKRVFDYYGQREELKNWLKLYDERLSGEEHSEEEMKKINPKFILRSYIAQEVIEEVEADKTEKLAAWLKVLKTPFDEHPDFEAYSKPTPPEHKNYEVSCSS